MEDRTTQTLRYGAATIVIHRPVLTESERAKREQQTRDALAGVMRDYMKRKEITP
jgi:hypothetical protein